MLAAEPTWTTPTTPQLLAPLLAPSRSPRRSFLGPSVSPSPNPLEFQTPHCHCPMDVQTAAESAADRGGKSEKRTKGFQSCVTTFCHRAGVARTDDGRGSPKSSTSSSSSHRHRPPPAPASAATCGSINQLGSIPEQKFAADEENFGAKRAGSLAPSFNLQMPFREGGDSGGGQAGHLRRILELDGRWCGQRFL